MDELNITPTKQTKADGILERDELLSQTFPFIKCICVADIDILHYTTFIKKAPRLITGELF